MQRSASILSVLLMCSLLPFACTDDADAVDRIMVSYQGENPGASLLIIKDGEVFLQRNYGYANLAPREHVTASTNFRLASVSKQFTATCVLQLIQAGKLSLHTTLPEMFPGFPAYGTDVTVEQLLAHTSGIPDYEDYVADTAFNPQVKDQGVLDILMQLEEGYFTPGTQFRYSNSAYALLALLVEKYSGLSYGEYLQQHIFSPLGMDATVAHEEGKTTVENRAYGHAWRDDAWVLHDQSSTSAVLGDGGIYSSVNDLYKWDQALYAGTVLPADIIQKSFAYQQLTDGTAVDYGYGWRLKTDKNGRQVVYHPGSTMSFRNIYYRVPELGLSIIVLTNRNLPDEMSMLPLAEQIAEAIGY